ncbi:MAG: hypothetical protein AAF830_10470 [Pseudomonadota bacterium]
MNKPDEIVCDILWFAQFVGRQRTSPEDVARRRGWIDTDGLPTAAGLELVRALRDQSETRSVFRGAA